MPVLTQTRAAWGSDAFADVFRQEIAALGARGLPLQQGIARGNYALDEVSAVSLLGAHEQDGRLRIHAGLFYTSLITGCACIDDPTPEVVIPEYCEVQVELDLADGTASIHLAPD